MVEENTRLSATGFDLSRMPSISQRDLTRAWESFVETGHFPAQSPRTVIARSWQRSRKLGLDPRAKRAPTVMSDEEIEAWLAHEYLGQAGRPVLKNLADALHGTRHVIVLADGLGRIIYSTGHRQIQDHLERINFRPGGGWNESEVGPNGIGTPLALGYPEIVLGVEHYCQGWQPWVCYGAPIIDPLNHQRPMGIIDITGDASNISQEAMLLAISVAQTVQSELSVHLHQRRDRLRGIAKDKRARWPEDGVIVVDLEGRIVDANARASRYLNVDYSLMFNRPVSEFLPDIWSTIESSLIDGAEGELAIRVQTESGVVYPGYCRIEPISYGNECVGALLVLNNHRGKRCEDARPLSSKTRFRFDNILGQSSAIKNTLHMAMAAARDPLENSVLLVGETGTGKELIAHAIHAEGTRADGPFIAINCGALPRDLIESELFGYAGGAFTGARREGQPGKFELAHNGTLFLDEINSLAPDLQANFLRVLDNKEITRLGSSQSISVNVRIVAAVTPELEQALESGRFRLDLYHRLCVLEVRVPPLRERGDDVLALAEYFLDKESLAAGCQPPRLSDDARDYLRRHHWPGNIRELRNLCIRWLLTAEHGEISSANVNVPALRTVAASPTNTIRVVDVENDLIRRTLAEVNGNVSEAARRLGIDRSTIYRRRRLW